MVSPLIALMQDQVAALTQLGVRAAFLNSTLDARAADAVERALVAGELDLLYVAPERLLTPRCLDLLARRASRCSRSTRRTACPSGATISGRSTSSSRCCASASRACPASR